MGFQVAMDDPAVVGVLHGRGDFGHQFHDPSLRQSLGVTAFGEASALGELHGKIGDAVFFPDFVDGQDSRMIEPRESARFHGKPTKERLAIRAGPPRGF